MVVITTASITDVDASALFQVLGLILDSILLIYTLISALSGQNAVIGTKISNQLCPDNALTFILQLELCVAFSHRFDILLT